jgi:peptidoglycan/LPS O-acetylase OafA/YrhL
MDTVIVHELTSTEGVDTRVPTKGPHHDPYVTTTHRADVQGMRGLAVLLVVAYHAKVVLPGGFVGVDVFFVISGFVITMSLLRELETNNQISFRAFYTRRVKRLLPALALTLAVTALFTVLLSSPFGPQATAAKTGISASLFSSNAYLYVSPSGYFDAPAAVNPLLHMWSLSVEEQFYFGFPILLAVAWRLIGKVAWSAEDQRRLLGYTLAGIGTLSLGMCVVLTSLSGPLIGIAEPGRLAFYAPVTRAWEFIAGGLVAIAAPRLFLLRRFVSELFGVLGVALIGFAAIRFDEFTKFPGYLALVPVVGSMFIINAGSVSVGGVQRVLGHRSLVWLGDLSYGWYLWHWPCIVAARLIWNDNRIALVGAAVFSLLPAVASYRLLENRIRYSQTLTGRKIIGLAACCVLVPLIAWTGVFAGTRAGWKDQGLINARAQLSLHADELRNCRTTDSLTAPQCRWDPVGESRGTIALVGDSNAGHFIEGLVQAANEMSYSVIVSTQSACPFVDLDVAQPGIGFDTWCTNHVKEVTERLIQLRPTAVVVASASDRYLSESLAVRLPGTSTEATSATDKADMWTAGLESTLTRLTVSGVPVLAINPTPRFVEFDPGTRCMTIQAITDVERCGETRSRSDALDDRILAVEAEQAAVAGAGDAAMFFDPFDTLCPGDPCETTEAGTFIYRDHAHLSLAGSQKLAPDFSRVLTELLN